MESNEENKSPYCKVCKACGEEGCCSATTCQHSPDGEYCETYLNELKFGYLMYKDMWELVTGEEEKKKLEKLFSENYDLIFNKQK